MVGDVSSDPSGFIGGIKDGTWTGVIAEGVGYGHLKMNDKWQKVLRTAKDYNVPVSVVTAEGLVTSNEYAVAKPLYKEGINHSGTLNAKEAQIRMATCIGHEEKIKFRTEYVAELFNVEPLDIDSAFIVPGLLFKNPEQRKEWAHVHHYSTNIDYAITPNFLWEEKILLAGLNNAYVSGKMRSTHF